MSSFFSNKYLRYKRLSGGSAAKITVDLMCATCGYNLRGLSPGRNCPECGTQIPFERRPTDPLLSGSQSEKMLLMWGLTGLALSAAAMVGLRLGFGVVCALSHRGVIPIWAYGALALSIALGWSVAAILVLPRRLDTIAPRRRIMRIAARWSQIAWPIATALWLVAATRFALAPSTARLLLWAYLMMTIGGIGWLMLAFVLQQTAEEAELDDAPRRLGLAIYVVPVLTVVMFLLPLDARFFVLALFGPVVLAWAWYALGFALAAWEMRVQVAWALRLAADGGDRERRMAETRRELDAEALATVRDLPHEKPDARRPLKLDR